MLVIEFVNCWCVCVMVCCRDRNDFVEKHQVSTSYLLQPPAIFRQIRSPQGKTNARLRPQKFPATLNLEDKWTVCWFNCLLTPSSVRI